MLSRVVVLLVVMLVASPAYATPQFVSEGDVLIGNGVFAGPGTCGACHSEVPANRLYHDVPALTLFDDMPVGDQVYQTWGAHDSILSPPGNDLPSTPLPGTLPLMGAGLGALGLLGWRRKRKARAECLSESEGE